MSNLAPRGGGRLSRRQREQRAYRLVMVGGTAGVVTVVGAVLAIAGVIGAAIPFFAAVLTLICWLLFRRTVSP